MMEKVSANWPAFWKAFIDGGAATALIVAIALWFTILPTVGLLYFAGILV